MTCSLGLGLAALSPAAVPWPGVSAGAASGIGALPRPPSHPGCGPNHACAGIGCTTGPPAGIRLIRTASSPSLISISAIPESSSSSISFLIFRMSMPGTLPLVMFVLERTVASGRGGRGRLSADRTAGQMPAGGAHGKLVAEGAEARDHPERDVGEIGLAPECLARRRAGQMHLDHRQANREHRIAQRNAGVSEGAGVEDQHPDLLGGRLLNAGDELVLRVALEAQQLSPLLASKLLGPPLDRLQAVGAVNSGLAGSEQIQIRAVEQQQTG